VNVLVCHVDQTVLHEPHDVPFHTAAVAIPIRRMHDLSERIPGDDGKTTGVLLQSCQLKQNAMEQSAVEDTCHLEIRIQRKRLLAFHHLPAVLRQAQPAGIVQPHRGEMSEETKIFRSRVATPGCGTGQFARKRGSIVHITSVQALLGFPGYPHYAASKGAIISLTRQMSREYAGQGIRVNCVAPGTVETPLNIQVLERAPDPKALRTAWEKMHPIGRLGQPIDVAYGALYLASDESSWVTGQCLVIDGGASSSALV
jgi:NAD(P)-dependent dehydrogenase (short-subunit alcohol dehydrogenase family)